MASPTVADDGYALLPGFLDATELSDAREAVGAALASPRGPSCERPHNTLVPLRWCDPLVDLVLARTDRVERLRAVAAATDLRWISGYVSIKPAGSGALPWHQDWWCWDHPVSYRRAPSQVALLVYLCDTDERRGALRLIPGSHLGAPPPAPREQTLRLAAGDACVIDYRLLHGTHPNHGTADRHAVLVNFTPAWGSLPADVRAHLVRQTSLPGPGEDPTEHWTGALLPTYAGTPRDLPLRRLAPPAWSVARDAFRPAWRSRPAPRTSDTR